MIAVFFIQTMLESKDYFLLLPFAATTQCSHSTTRRPCRATIAPILDRIAQRDDRERGTAHGLSQRRRIEHKRVCPHLHRPAQTSPKSLPSASSRRGHALACLNQEAWWRRRAGRLSSERARHEYRYSS